MWLKCKEVFTFNSLLDAKVEALATIDLCKYRLRNEHNSLVEKASIKKDIREARKTNRLIDKEIKGRKKRILDDHYGPDASSDFGILVAMGILTVVGTLAGLHYFTDVDVMGILETAKTTLGPLVEELIEIIKSYLM